eukprot:TRINITY_DN64194_c0_g1_i1.p1 TRINITY_DN64194_c0_g1~~TRINITY_DN64194_c0_g1_i1.p1  ORF type:complete len:421 (-),score=47.54 TRINITY_DN64194_c0_g1_i1:54-1316(-)
MLGLLGFVSDDKPRYSPVASNENNTYQPQSFSSAVFDAIAGSSPQTGVQNGSEIFEYVKPQSASTEPTQEQSYDKGTLKIIFQVTTIVTTMMFIYCAIVYNIIFLGMILPDRGKDAYCVPFSILFNSLWFLAFTSFYQAKLANPGTLPEKWHDFVRKVGPRLHVVPAGTLWKPGKATFCAKCGAPRPERAHHCNISGFCVLRMDHYCPWINKCVGFHNYKFFLLLVCYAMCCSAVGLLTALPELLLCLGGITFGPPSQADIVWIKDERKTEKIMFLVYGFVAFFMGLLIIPMLCMHIPLAFSNLTAIEMNYTNHPNPYDLLSWKANLEQFMGRPGIDWFLPVAPWHPRGDGVSFPVHDEFGEWQLQDTFMEGEQLWMERYHIPKQKPLEQNDGWGEDFNPLNALGCTSSPMPSHRDGHGI